MEKSLKSEYFIEYEEDFNSTIKQLNKIGYSDDFNEDTLEIVEADIDKCSK